MATPPTSSADHEQFDQLCARVSDWETLPSVVTEPAEIEPEENPADEQTPLDGLILAGLVAP